MAKELAVPPGTVSKFRQYQPFSMTTYLKPSLQED
jgi:hypothetical protein